MAPWHSKLPQHHLSHSASTSAAAFVVVVVGVVAVAAVAVDVIMVTSFVVTMFTAVIPADALQLLLPLQESIGPL